MPIKIDDPYQEQSVRSAARQVIEQQLRVERHHMLLDEMLQLLEKMQLKVLDDYPTWALCLSAIAYRDLWGTYVPESVEEWLDAQKSYAGPEAGSGLRPEVPGESAGAYPGTEAHL